MFEPVRGGTRGGQAEFKWSDVSADKDRENYLGHSINAPTGRWQKNKDIHWYNRDLSDSALERAEEIRKVKELEADALAVALGFEPASKTVPTAGNLSESSPTAAQGTIKAEPGDDRRALEKEEKRKRKAERREEKRMRKEKRRVERGGDYAVDDIRVRRLEDRSRSRSPPRHHTKDHRLYEPRRPRSRSRSRTPPYRESISKSHFQGHAGYNAEDTEKQKDRRRRDTNPRRDEPARKWNR